MKHLSLFGIIFFLLACGAAETPSFVMEMEAELLIPAGLNSFDTHYFIIEDVPTRFGIYSNSSFDPITRIQSSNAQLEGRVQDFDYSIIDQIIIEVISQKDPSVQKEIFYNNLIPFSEDRDLRLLSSLSDVADILSEDFVDLEIRLIFKTFTPREMDTRINMSFNAYASE